MYNFNTTLVWVRPEANLLYDNSSKFQYNTCLGSTLKNLALSKSSWHFNTTLVWVRPNQKPVRLYTKLNFNTTLVWVRLYIEDFDEINGYWFQYNTCLGSTNLYKSNKLQTI